jgi:hypothetical protein
MAALVMQQGELIDQIERSVSMSVEHTAAANVELDSAIRAQRCGRRVNCFFLMILIMIDFGLFLEKADYCHSHHCDFGHHHCPHCHYPAEQIIDRPNKCKKN